VTNATSVGSVVGLSVFLAVWVGFLVVLIVSLVQVVRIPDHQFRAAGSEKVTWILLVVLLNPVGGLIWLLSKRKKLRAARGVIPPPPPGWYPEPSGALRWWDGSRWSDVQHVPPPPPTGFTA
jgi:H+/Cl- antiporter ClcA